MMACKYCNVKPPGKNAVIKVGKCPIGKPFFTNRDEYGIYAYALIYRMNGCPDFPAPEEWHLNYINNGVGHCIPINFCPMCGEKLGGS